MYIHWGSGGTAREDEKVIIYYFEHNWSPVYYSCHAHTNLQSHSHMAIYYITVTIHHSTNTDHTHTCLCVCGSHLHHSFY